MNESTYKDIIRHPSNYLRGEQMIAWTFKTTAPMLIKGGAGSGKTIVAMLRSIYARKVSLESLWGSGKVLFLTYDKQLRDEIGWAMSGQDIDVMTVDSWVYRYLSSTGDPLDKKPSDAGKLVCYLKEAISQVFKSNDSRSVAHKDADFYYDEISWIKGRGFLMFEEYASSDRFGRGGDARLGESDRRTVWELKEKYDALCSEAGREMFEDRVLRAWRSISECGLSPELQYDHVVVDEAQDFTYLKLKIVAALAKGDSPESKGITLVADVAQEIYQSGFSWKDADIAIRGRTRVFKRNYRNTRQIAEAAYSLMANEEFRAEMTDMDLPDKDGDLPELWVLKRPLDSILSLQEKEVALNSMRSLLEKRIATLTQGTSCVVATHTRAGVNELKTYFEGRGFCVNVKDPVGHCRASGFSKKKVIHLRTFHRMKGLQFDHVFLWDLSEGKFDRVDSVSVLRKLIYVGMTRACRTLVLCVLESPLGIIKQIDRSLLNVVEV